jgi:drug/metabolite transporter superfamily protein YnfA
VSKIIIILMTIIGLVYAGPDTVPQETVQLQETIIPARSYSSTVIGAVLASHGGSLLILSIIFLASGSEGRDITYDNPVMNTVCIFVSASEIVIGVHMIFRKKLR